MAHASDKRILVVDDEPDVRQFLATCIADAGFQVDTAVDGEDALEQARANPPDLMTLDMVMPRKSGIRVIRTLREDDRFASMPIIVITAHAHDELASDDIKGFNAFTSGLRPRYTLEKPISPDKLVQAISDILAVDVETQADGDGSAGKDELMRMIEKSDPDTLAAVQAMLNNKKA